MVRAGRRPLRPAIQPRIAEPTAAPRTVVALATPARADVPDSCFAAIVAIVTAAMWPVLASATQTIRVIVVRRRRRSTGDIMARGLGEASVEAELQRLEPFARAAGAPLRPSPSPPPLP